MKRQFAVTHHETGQVTLVNHFEWRPGAPDYAGAALKAGHRFVVDCDVSLVRHAKETPLPFDELPLIIRRGHKNGGAS